MTDLTNLVNAVKQSAPDDAIGKLDKVLSLQGKVEVSELQRAYVDAILSVVAKNPKDDLLKELHSRLQKTPAYNEDQELVSSHARALIKAAAGAPTYQLALKRAGQITELKGYGASAAIQEAHAEALFEAAQQPMSDALGVSEKIAEIPSFRDSNEIQFSYSKALCNLTGSNASQKKLDKAIAGLRTLPNLESDPRLRSSLEKAERNRERFQQLKSESGGKVPWKAVVAAAILAGGMAFAPTIVQTFNPPPEPSKKQTTQKVAPSVSSDKAELDKYLEKARSFYDVGNYSEALVYAGMSLKRADALKELPSQVECYDLLIASGLHQGDSTNTKYLSKIPQSHLAELAEKHLARAKAHQQAKSAGPLKIELSMVLRLARESKDQKLDEALAGAFVICEEQPLHKAGALIQAELGDLGKAAELAEKSGDLELTEKFLRSLVKSDKEAKPRLFAFLKKSAVQTLGKADKALAEKDYENSASLAKAALERVEECDNCSEEKAQGHTILAKCAYLQSDYRLAVKEAKKADDLSSTPERKQRLADYKYKDAEVVTLDELDVDTFVFPPTQKTDKKYTYFYYMSKDWRTPGAVKEELFTTPKDDIKVRLAYPKKDQGIRVRIESYKGAYYSVEFDANRKRVLTPGLYKDATRFPFNNNNPGLDFSGNGSGHNKSEGKFKVHQIEWQGDKIKALAVDFIFEGRSNSPRPVFGKVRYRSNYR